MRYLICVLLLLFVCSYSYGDTVKSTIGTGKEYTTVTLWHDDTYNSATGSDDAIGEMYDEVYTENVVLSDTTPSTITLRPATGEGHVGTAGTGARIISTTGTPVTINATSNVTVDQLEISHSGTSSGNFGIGSAGNYDDIVISRCIVHDIYAHQAYQVATGIRAAHTGARMTFVNNIVYDIDQQKGSPSKYAKGIYVRTTGVYNNTVHNCNATTGSGGYGIQVTNGGTLQNNISTDSGGDDYTGSPSTESYNLASDDTDAGTGSIGADDGVLTTKLYVSTTGGGSEDLHVQDADADQVDAGTDLGAVAAAVDIDGFDRNADTSYDPWDMGAHELQAAGGVTFIPRIIIW